MTQVFKTERVPGQIRDLKNLSKFALAVLLLLTLVTAYQLNGIRTKISQIENNLSGRLDKLEKWRSHVSHNLLQKKNVHP